MCVYVAFCSKLRGLLVCVIVLCALDPLMCIPSGRVRLRLLCVDIVRYALLVYVAVVIYSWFVCYVVVFCVVSALLFLFLLFEIVCICACFKCVRVSCACSLYIF